MTSTRVEAIIAPLEADLDQHWIVPSLKAHIIDVIKLARQLSSDLAFSAQVADDIRNQSK